MNTVILTLFWDRVRLLVFLLVLFFLNLLLRLLLLLLLFLLILLSFFPFLSLPFVSSLGGWL